MSADDTVTKFAQKHRMLAAAALVQIAGDESTAPNARAQAAEKILAYSDDRPGISRRITLTDVAQLNADHRQQLGEALVGIMSHDERQHLLHLLLTYYELEMPGEFKVKMVAAFEEVLAKQAKGPRFERNAMPSLPAPSASPTSVAERAQKAAMDMANVDSHANACGSQRRQRARFTRMPADVDISTPKPQAAPVVNGRIPVNPLLPHLDMPSPNGSGGTTDNRWTRALREYEAAVWRWKQ